MKTDRELLEFIATEVSTLKTQVDGITKNVSELKEGQLKTNLAIENDIKPRINALFDGYQLNSEKLDRIESEVAKYEEIILRRVR